MALEHCRVILIETHYPGNLGATARVMRNLGLSDLVLIAPIADRNHKNARQMSTHGESILNDAHIVADLGEAIGDCVLVVGTSARSGGLFRRQIVGPPQDVTPRVVEVLRQNRPAAILFGPEPTGLSNEIVTRCQYLIQVPTADGYSSLNLAQAVAICLYEVRTAWLKLSSAPRVEDLASVESQEHMFRQLQTALEEIHFLYGDKAEPLMHAVRHLLGKARLTEMETKVLLGLARQIRWYVANRADKINEL
jgi:tRNA/rRNA methyltransferase